MHCGEAREGERRKSHVSSRCYVLSRVQYKIEVDKINCITMLMSEYYSIELTEQSTHKHTHAVRKEEAMDREFAWKSKGHRQREREREKR